MTAAKRDATDGRKRRWQQHNADRRQTIIDAALTVLARGDASADGLSAQQISDEAGVHRTVLYRYFSDRTDLDIAIQREICRRAGEVLTAAVVLEGTPEQITRRIVGAYVDWSVDNLSLLRYAEREISGASVKPLEVAIEQIAEQIEMIIGAFVTVLGAELSDDDRASLAPLVSFLVRGATAAVRTWTGRDELVPAAPAFTDLLADLVWLQIQGLATARSIELPDTPIEELFDLGEEL